MGEKPFITASYARQRKEQGKARAPIPQSRLVLPHLATVLSCILVA